MKLSIKLYAHVFLDILLCCCIFIPPYVRQINDPITTYETWLEYLTIDDMWISLSIFIVISCCIQGYCIDHKHKSLMMNIKYASFGQLFGTLLFYILILCCGGKIFEDKKLFATLDKSSSIRDIWNAMSFTSILLSMLMCNLTLFPLFVHFHTFGNNEFWTFVLSVRMTNYTNADYYRNVGWCTIIGCIVGSYILALDWWKTYQAYPLPCIIGAFFGHFFGSLLMIVLNRNRKQREE